MDKVVWARRSFKVELLAETMGTRPKRVEWVRGITWGHFGIYKGFNTRLAPEDKYYTVVLLSCMAPFLTLPKQELARQAVMEFAALDLDWSAPEQKSVTGPDLEKCKEVWRRWHHYEKHQQEERWRTQRDQPYRRKWVNRGG
jgi:hypothetical protein